MENWPFLIGSLDRTSAAGIEWWVHLATIAFNLTAVFSVAAAAITYSRFAGAWHAHTELDAEAERVAVNRRGETLVQIRIRIDNRGLQRLRTFSVMIRVKSVSFSDQYLATTLRDFSNMITPDEEYIELKANSGINLFEMITMPADASCLQVTLIVVYGRDRYEEDFIGLKYNEVVRRIAIADKATFNALDKLLPVPDFGSRQVGP